MTSKTTLKLKTHPADFEVLASSFYTITREMGLAMERTARSPIYFAAHDFISAILTPEGELISVAEYIPILIGATPFHIRAVTRYFGDDIKQGDIFLVNDPYTYDGGNHLADWCIVYPVFYKGKLKYMIAQKAHQQDTGGGVPGGYNPNALDVWGEGLRIPPVKIFEGGQERKDVLNLILTNVRVYETQRGDLLSLIGASRLGERRLVEILDRYGEEAVSTFITDLLNYSEFRIREEIDKVTDGTYHGETNGIGDASVIAADITIKGNEVVVDMTQSGPQVKEFVNSPIANTYSAVWVGILTSLGKKIERQYRNGGCFRPIKLLTIPGTIVHSVMPATVGNCTLFVADQITEVVWDALSKAAPETTPSGWGHSNCWIFSGIDPRRNERYGAPDFLDSQGAGAIWGTDGWSCGGAPHGSGTLWRPEIEVVESQYPLFRKRWELATDSGGPGKMRGGLGVENNWVVDAGREPVYLASAADPYEYEIVPAIRGGKLPPPYSKRIIFASGEEKTKEDISRAKFFVLHSGDQVVDFTGGGAGAGDPLERDVEAVREDVRDELVSIKSARDDYGVVIDPVTLQVDYEQTESLRRGKKREQAK